MAATKTLTFENFKSIVEEPGIVMVDWWAAWCGPCRTFAPIFEQAAGRHPTVTFGKVDTDAQQQLAGGFGIQSIPTLMAFRDGILVFEQAGVLPGNALDQLIAQVKALDMAAIRAELASASAPAAGQ